MSLATHRQLLSTLPDTIMRASMESVQNHFVSCFSCLLLALADNCQIQDSGSGLVNAENVLITGGNFIVSLCCWLNKN